jgi:hypothetical protein
LEKVYDAAFFNFTKKYLGEAASWQSPDESNFKQVAKAGANAYP